MHPFFIVPTQYVGQPGYFSDTEASVNILEVVAKDAQAVNATDRNVQEAISSINPNSKLDSSSHLEL